MKIAVVGGGAAGFFAAITAKSTYPEAEVVLYERSGKPLSKVRISGGGRCNVTNGTRSISELAKAYPRGGKKLKKLFPSFNTRHVIEWFESRGVGLVEEADGRVFPDTHRSSTIIDCLMEELKRLGIQLETRAGVEGIRALQEGVELKVRKGSAVLYDKLVVATGGSPKRKGLEWLEELGHKIEEPVPSLFTFNMPGNGITELAGISVENVSATVQGSKLKAEGPLLITHWGMSGPAILKLSAFGARELSQKSYSFDLQVNWANKKEEAVREELVLIAKEAAKKALNNVRPFELPKRLWSFLLDKMDLAPDKEWGSMGKKELNRMVDVLTRDVHAVMGKSTFKEEFVTSGGVSLESVNMKSMESTVCPGLYFAGEVLDIDAITGGYNFQAAWTTGYVAGLLG